MRPRTALGLVLAAAEIAAWSGPCATGASAAAGQAQSEPAPRPAFEVASVKPHKDDGVGPRNPHSTYGPQGVDFGWRPLSFLISEAYQVNGGRIVGPDSLTKEALWAPLTQAYDVVAKADHAVPKDQLRLMLQSLLADRFKLQFHRESKTRPVYRLVVAKGGPKLEESNDGGDLVMSGDAHGFTFRNAEIMRLCGALSSFVDRIVVDDTGLQGLYNFTLEIPEDLRQNRPAKSDGKSPDSPSAGMFSDILKRMGLQLIAGTAPVEYLVVDHVERPSEN